MKIVIDIQGAQSESKFRGIGRYTFSTALALAKNAGEHEIWLVLNSAFTDSISDIRDAIKDYTPQEHIVVFDVVLPVFEQDQNNQNRARVAELVREYFLEQLNPDIVLLTSLFEGFVDNAVTSVGLFSKKYKTAVILYDLIPYMNQDIYLNNKIQHEYYMRKIESLKKADLLFSISKSSKQEGIDYLNISENKIVNISAAVDNDFKKLELNDSEIKDLYKKYNISRKMIAYVPADFDIRKNFEKLIEAYSNLSQNIKDSHQLVIVSKIQEGDRVNLLEIAKQYGLKKDELILTGYVSDEELIMFYNLANLFVFPSIHEGFGLPVLEAINCGAVVIGSNTTSIPEVIGCEEALFDPHSAESIASKIEEVLSDKNLRSRLLDKQQEHKKSFSWDTSAKSILKILESHDFQSSKTDNYPNYKPYELLIEKITPYVLDHTDEDIKAIANSIFYTHKKTQKKQLFLDVSELCQRDSATGIQRVVKAYLKELLIEPPKDFDIIPVYATVETEYKSANKFKAKFLGEKGKNIEDEPIKPQKGDLFFGLDMQHHVQLSHKQYFYDLKNRGVKVLFLVHDLLPIELNDMFNNDELKHLHEELMKMFSRLDGVICISKGTSDSYTKWLSEKKIVPLPHFTNEWVHNGSGMKASNPSTGLPNDYQGLIEIMHNKITFLAVSTIEPRKKQDQILEAIEVLWKDGIHVNIIFVGKGGWKTESFIKKIVEHEEYNQRLFWLNGISDEYLDLIYKNSSALIAASINEGFGLPLVEAAQYKIPIIARDIPVFKEIAGNNAYYFSGFEAVDLSKSLKKWIDLYNDNKHPKSDNLKYNTWKESTQQLLFVLTQNKPKNTLFLDISELITKDAGTGIQRVVKNLLFQLLKNPPYEYDVIPVYATVDDSYRFAGRFTYKCLNHGDIEIEDNYIEYKSGDIFFLLDLQPGVQIQQSSFYNKMMHKGVKVGFMLHDLLPVDLPEFFPKGTKEGFENWLRVMSLLDFSVCVSNQTAIKYKQWLSNQAEYKKINIQVSHSGVDIGNSMSSKGLPDNAKSVLDTIQSKDSFLIVGTIEPRKGHMQTLKAFEILWEANQDVNLVIVGKKGWLVDELVKKLRTHPKLNKRFFWLEGISDEYLEKVYSTSSCLIAASEGEGFGLSLIEAAQKKKPIIARDIPVFREAAGEYAYYFENSKDPKVLAKTIEKWIELYKADKHPKSDTMPWLTWEESTQQLLSCLNIDIHLNKKEKIK